MLQKENQLQKKLRKADSVTAETLFAHTQEKYLFLIEQIKTYNIKSAALSGEYLPYGDSIKNALAFLQQNKSISHITLGYTEKITASVSGFDQLQSKLEVSDHVREFIAQRKQQLRQTFANYSNMPGVKKYLGDYSKQVHYYTQQIKEYKSILNDPDKLQRKTLSMLNQLPAFKQFMEQHSMLALVFNVSGEGSGFTNQTNIAPALATREQVMTSIQNAAGPTGAAMTSLLQKNIQSEEAQLSKLRDKLNLHSTNGADLDMPNFKPNSQKTKGFLQRLEYGTNLQTVHGSYYFPTTTDLGLTLGYKITNECSFGIGASYKIGWGKDFKNIHISSEGVGLRSYLEMPLKKTFFASGGLEYNYQLSSGGLPASIERLTAKTWQQSGLIGITKIVSLKTTMLKKSKMQLLWDFLSYQQVPRTQPVKFRVGYSF